MDLAWWQSGVVYQIYPRSFADASGDGVGDLEGMIRHLDHLTWLGVDALWTSPIYPSPMADFGYDVSNYTDIDPVFGTLADFDQLVTAAHARDLRVLLDWVPNHTSDRHPWFMASRGSRDNPYRDWYVWRDGAADGGPPNNWRRAFEDGPAWTHDDRTGQWYLHHFLPAQPDLDWNTPDVREAMHDTLRFWLDRGVDGFRADVVHMIGKHPALDDVPPDMVDVDRIWTHYDQLTHDWLRGIRGVLDSYPGDRMMVGEINLDDPTLVARHTGPDQLHMAFNFNLLRAPWGAASFRDAITRVDAAAGEHDTWPTLVLSNHDESRHRTRYGGDERRARVAAVMLLTLRGTPFLYAGEELGLEDAHVPADRVVDPGGRDPQRAPIPWTEGPLHGWAGEPWLPWPPEPDVRNAERQRRDRDSIAALYRRLLRLRRADEVLQGGALELRDAPDGVLAYDRVAGDTRRRVLANCADAEVAVPVDGTWRVAVATGRRREGATYDGSLAPVEAVVLTPAT
jgi:alpha-glucosidase